MECVDLIMEFLPECVQIHETQAISIHVRTGIALNGRTDLVILENNVTRPRPADNYCSTTSCLSQTQRLMDCSIAFCRMIMHHHTERLRFSSWRSCSGSVLCTDHQDRQTWIPLSTCGISWRGAFINIIILLKTQVSSGKLSESKRPLFPERQVVA